MRCDSAYHTEFEALINKWALDPASKPETVEELIDQCRDAGISLDLAESTKKVEFVELTPTPPNTVRFVIPAKSDVDTEGLHGRPCGAAKSDSLDASIENLNSMAIGDYSSLKCGVSGGIDDGERTPGWDGVNGNALHMATNEEAIQRDLEDLQQLEVGVYSSKKCGS